MIRISPQITLDDSEIEESFVRASGPGGQNVNKVSSAVRLRFDAANSPNLPDAVRSRLLRLAGARATNEGVIVIAAEDTRSQARNRELALARLIDLIREAEKRPRKRIPTRPTLASKRRRLEAKTRRGAVKSTRRRPEDE